MLVVVVLSFQQELAQVLPIQSVLIGWHQKLRIQCFNVQLYFLNELPWKVFAQIRVRVLLFEAFKSLAFFKTCLPIFLQFVKYQAVRVFKLFLELICIHVCHRFILLYHVVEGVRENFVEVCEHLIEALSLNLSLLFIGFLNCRHFTIYNFLYIFSIKRILLKTIEKHATAFVHL